MKKTPLKKKSSKQGVRDMLWASVCTLKMHSQIAERGYAFCEICGLPEKTGEWGKLWGHHIIPRGKGGKDTLENCEITHYGCQLNKYHGGNLFLYWLSD